MQTPNLSSSTDARTTLLQRAEEFVAGFEGDSVQEGVGELLASLRAAVQAGAIVIAAKPPHPGSTTYSGDDSFGMTSEAFWYRMYSQRESGWRNEAGKHFVQISFYDATDRLWKSSFPAITDDFGNLVAVPA